MRILLATDGSPQARGAEALAEWLAYKLSAPLTVLFVVDTRLARIPELLDFGALTVPVPVLRTELERALALRGEAVLERVRQSALAAGVAVAAGRATVAPSPPTRSPPHGPPPRRRWTPTCSPA